MVSNYHICDQSRNYTAYEYSLNIFRTINNGGTVIIGGDNIVFPITYARIIERMREDVTIYDRYNLFFRMPYMGNNKGDFVYHGEWDDLVNILEKEIIEKKSNHGVYYSLFNPYIISVPENYSLIPYGILRRVVNDRIEIDQKKRVQIWNYYVADSIEDTFVRDYMNREVVANYYYSKGSHLIMLGGIEPGLKRLKLASQIGYNDNDIHMELALSFSDLGYFDEARIELEKSLLYSQDLAGLYNNWGYYYSKKGETNKAIDSIKKAIEIDPGNTLYYNNLGSLLLETGQKDLAIKMFKKSLLIKNNQEGIKKILQENDIKTGDEE
jgi:tetratricopeptide (TPR) repeat protein